jgi:hypothetical protein
MKIVYLIIVIIVIAAAAFYGVTVYKQFRQATSIVVSTGRSQPTRLVRKQESTLPQSGDPCNGTGGNGQIVSVGNNSITTRLLRNGRLLKKGSSQVVDLTSQTMIKTSTGSGVISDLKTGDNVTIGGKPNPDGSFTAMIVAVCNGK